MTSKKASKSARTAAKKTNGKATKASASKAASQSKKSTKKDLVLELLRRKEGATSVEIAKATDWQAHSIRGFISGHLTKKMGLVVESTKNEGGERAYRIAQ